MTARRLRCHPPAPARMAQRPVVLCQQDAVLRPNAPPSEYLRRQSDCDPGIKTISRGLRRVRDFAAPFSFAVAAPGL